MFSVEQGVAATVNAQCPMGWLRGVRGPFWEQEQSETIKK